MDKPFDRPFLVDETNATESSYVAKIYSPDARNATIFEDGNYGDRISWIYEPLQREKMDPARFSGPYNQDLFDRFQRRYRLNRGYPHCESTGGHEHQDAITCRDEKVKAWELCEVPSGIRDGSLSCAIPRDVATRTP